VCVCVGTNGSDPALMIVTTNFPDGSKQPQQLLQYSLPNATTPTTHRIAPDNLIGSQVYHATVSCLFVWKCYPCV
jgi:hypothetical protein